MYQNVLSLERTEVSSLCFLLIPHQLRHDLFHRFASFEWAQVCVVADGAIVLGVRPMIFQFAFGWKSGSTVKT